ncbi:MAG: hypothetical protein LBI33_02990 [Propionibacteriaceae bacterium]|jgi:hypothetical protein|nr:hypothetical protein [Propionibacteriaceae bacterium]
MTTAHPPLIPREKLEQPRGTDNIASAHVAEVTAQSRRQRILEDLREYEDRHGKFTDEELRTAERDLTPWAPLRMSA